MRTKIVKFLEQFPDNATCWSQATDEVRYLARSAKEYYNEVDLNLSSDEVEAGQGQQPLNFRAIQTPAEWNIKGKKYILEVFDKMSQQAKEQFFETHKYWLG